MAHIPCPHSQRCATSLLIGFPVPLRTALHVHMYTRGSEEAAVSSIFFCPWQQLASSYCDPHAETKFASWQQCDSVVTQVDLNRGLGYCYAIRSYLGASLVENLSCTSALATLFFGLSRARCYVYIPSCVTQTTSLGSDVSML